MQTAAYVGFRARGAAGRSGELHRFWSSRFFSWSDCQPSMHTHTLPPVVAVFNGLQIIVVAIVANATVSFGKTSLKGFSLGV